MKRSWIYVISIFFGLAFVAAVFVVGVLFGRVADFDKSFSDKFSGTPAAADGTFVEQLLEVERILDSESLRPASEASKSAGAIRGLLEGTGDEHAFYFDEQHFGFFNEQTEGEFFGIGVNIGQRDGGVYVISVIEGTPAERAGIKADDIFVRIDDVEREEWTTQEVVRRVRGPEGTKVGVTIFRPAEEKKLDFTIERAKIDIPNVTQELQGDVGYVRLMTFNNNSEADLRAAIQALSDDGAKGLVLDLRDNTGGLLQSSVDVASIFIPDGKIVSVEDRSGAVNAYRASGRDPINLPLVVLMNENSASASEVLVGALQDHGRARVVGQKSFGKGSVQSVRELSFGGAIKFTTAHYVTPKGREINGVGLEPDVLVEMDPALQEDKATDTQRKRAIELVLEEL